MSEKRVSLPEEVYEKLQEERRPDETVGDVVDRLLGRRQLSEFWGAWEDGTAADAREAIHEARSSGAPESPGY